MDFKRDVSNEIPMQPKDSVNEILVFSELETNK